MEIAWGKEKENKNFFGVRGLGFRYLEQGDNYSRDQHSLLFLLFVCLWLLPSRGSRTADQNATLASYLFVRLIHTQSYNINLETKKCRQLFAEPTCEPKCHRHLTEPAYKTKTPSTPRRAHPQNTTRCSTHLRIEYSLLNPNGK